MKRFSIIFFWILVLIGAVRAFGVDWYVRPNGGSYGAENGTSWADAFDGMADVNIGAGDVLYVGAGTYTVGLDVNTAIQDGSWTMRAAQDTHVGLAIFDGGGSYAINLRGYDNITIDGSGPSGERNIVFRDNLLPSGTSGNYCLNLSVSSCAFTNAVFSAPWSTNVRQTNNIYKLESGTGEDYVFSNNASDNTAAYRQSWIVNCQLYVPGKVNDGLAPDGFQPGRGTTLIGRKMQAFLGETTSTEHQDLIQMYGNNYLEVIGCEFIDSADSQMGCDSGGEAASHIRAYNNIFRRTITNMGGNSMLRVYYGSGFLTSLTDIDIRGNTFIDGANHPSYGGAILLDRVASGATSSGGYIQNNLIYNCGATFNPIAIDSDLSQSGWTFSHNLINAGDDGTTGTSGWTQTSGQSGDPLFIAYTAYAATGNNFRIQSGSAAKDTGTTGALAYDFDNISRPQGSAWDIGAFEYQSGSASGPVANVQTMNAGNTFLRQ